MKSTGEFIGAFMGELKGKSIWASNETREEVSTLKIIHGIIITLFMTMLSSCNFYSSVDHPSGDAQVLSAARSCFDQGNFSCASTFYSQLSSASSDSGNSEAAFLAIGQNGATSGLFITSVLNGAASGGALITQVAEGLSTSGNTTQAARTAFFHAYQQTASISDPRVQGLVQFITSLSLLGELLGEAAGAPGVLKQTDLVSNPTQCASATLPFTGCTAPNSKLPTGTSSIGTLMSATDKQMTGVANLYMVNSVIVALDQGLNNMQTAGPLGSSASTFTQAIVNYGNLLLMPGTDSPGYRAILIVQGIGDK